MKKLFLKNYLILLILSIPIFAYYFIYEVQSPNYFICSELIDYTVNILSTKFEFRYPKSCDQELYQRGFTNLRQIFAEDFNYQDRPLYILTVAVVNTLVQAILSLSNLGSINTSFISTFLVQIGITAVSVVLIKKIFFKDTLLTITNSLLLPLVLLLSPLFKWGVFDPSHQLLTLVSILVSIYFVKSGKIVDLKTSFLFGLLFLLHRSFLVTFFWILLNEIYINRNHLIKDFKYACCLFFIAPTVGYQLYIRLVLGNKAYDANAEYWGQFIWIFDFIRGKINYQSEWHCVTIPGNFLCYFQDNLQLFLYISIPLLFVFYFYISKFKIKNSIEESVKLTISISLFLYVFWSFIGWYPPVRFSYYSLGHLFILLFINFIIKHKNNLGKFLISSSYIFYSLNLNHWNSPQIVNMNLFMYISFTLFIFYILYDRFFPTIIDNK
jgi:hypothetical protein